MIDQSMPVISNAEDWVWWVHTENPNHPPEVLKARDYFIDWVLPVFMKQKLPHFWVYDPVVCTSNFVCRKSDLPATIELILKDAEFYTKPIPEKDWQSSADLKEAILRGSNMNIKWN